MAHIAADIRRRARVPAHVNADGEGVAVGTGPVVIDAYEDFLCGAQVGLTDDGFATCVAEHAHRPRVAYVTEAAEHRPARPRAG
jgi:hypothetical protein